MSVEKERVSVTLTKPYLDALTHLVKEGVYMDRGSAIRAALRLLFASHGIPPFSGSHARASNKAELEGRNVAESDLNEATSCSKESGVTKRERKKMSEKEHEESLEYVEKRLIELIGEMSRRLKILDSVAVILKEHPDSLDDKLVLDKIRSTMSRYLEARAHAKSIGKEDEKEK